MKNIRLIPSAFFLSIISLIMHSISSSNLLLIISRSVDLSVLLLLLLSLYRGFKSAEYRKQFAIRNLPVIIFSAGYIIVLSYFIIIELSGGRSPSVNLLMIVLRSFFLLYLLFNNIKTLEGALRRLNTKPAFAIISSFLAVITAGTLLLMLPFTTADGQGLGFIDSWFTSTSAVCVTGLIVVDTASAFSLAGKIIILLLIQTGGLGIMIMTYISMFILGRKITFEERKRLSFAISDSDMSGIIETLKKIIYLTFTIEAGGAFILFAGLGRSEGFTAATAFSAVFHSISAFCNAGFSLFSNSLEDFTGSPLVIFTVSALIILGGLSFSVIFNIRDFILPKKGMKKLSLNTKVVLSWTLLLLFGGFFFFYASEHSGVLKDYSTPSQYLAAFFQSVTLRTAGFNSVAFSALGAGTLVVMCLFMFIGAASGSTAGGIKINTIAVMTAYLKSMITNSPKVTLYRHQLSKTRVLRAFIVFQYGITVVFAGTAAIALTHDAGLKDIIFETVSAFGTVGLSTGLTSRLNPFGKIIIIILMFNGRLGPLTILSGFSGRSEKNRIEYPQGDILIG